MANTNNQPLVSIIIPAYNAELYIAETINSIVFQTHSNWELIIVNDGSKDKTEGIIQSFLKDKRIQYHYQENAGVSVARNNGYHFSSGKYVAFLDADDLWVPHRLKKMLEKFQQEASLGLVHSYMQIINENSERQQEFHKGKEGHLLESLLLWNGCNIPAPSSILVKREVLERVGGFDKDLSTAADQEFFFRVANSYKVGMCKEVLGLYRVHGNNMHQNVSNMEKDHIRAYQKAKEYGLFKSKKFQRNCFSNLYLILAGSWWVNGNNKLRSAYFMIKAILKYPPNISKLLAKFG